MDNGSVLHGLATKDYVLWSYYEVLLLAAASDLSSGKNKEVNRIRFKNVHFLSLNVKNRR
jgi:hypothetical protein